MSPPPKLSGRAVVRAFERGGWHLARQKGSHMILVKEGSLATLSVPLFESRIRDSQMLRFAPII